jgi:phosphate/sulfate permease
MEFFLFVVIVLFILAVSDLIVGVSNDAVNFLNSAVGSKAAPRYVIMIIAGLGIIVGTLFSSGLMEVARKGIFHPDQFLLPEIMVIFLAVMITDILLLDFFNTIALPTSTTVSIVFELLGAAVVVSLIKIFEAGETVSDLVNYINTSKALAIISGILLSVVVAFTIGAIIQFFTRMIFTFDFEKRIKRYGALWGGVALTAITFFILIKGAKGASFITEEMQTWIYAHTYLIIGMSFLFWAILFQLMMLLTKINILKFIVLVGTFALALAFAANDLVNFIGVPLAGLSSYQLALENADPLNMVMTALKEPVQSNTWILMGAGVVMVVTLWVSRKARAVTRTEVNLGRQGEGYERFGSSVLSRELVRGSMNLFAFFKGIAPQSLQKGIAKRFNTAAASKEKIDGAYASFDLLRASVNLVVASILISFATSLKLPLSTTYVTFMVAMGTSLSDRAWGRESAVYRVNGVITVIGGWFMTALVAFTVAGTVALLIFYGEVYAVVGLLLFVLFMVLRTFIYAKKKEEEDIKLEKISAVERPKGVDALSIIMDGTNIYLNSLTDALSTTVNHLESGDRKKLKKAYKIAKKGNDEGNLLVSNILELVKLLDEEEIKDGHRYGKAIAALREISANMKSFTKRAFDHVDNNHRPPENEMMKELEAMQKGLQAQTISAQQLLEKKDFGDMSEFEDASKAFKKLVVKYNKHQVTRMKEGKSTTHQSLLFFASLSDALNISNHLSDFIESCKINLRGIED